MPKKPPEYQLDETGDYAFHGPAASELIEDPAITAPDTYSANLQPSEEQVIRASEAELAEIRATHTRPIAQHELKAAHPLLPPDQVDPEALTRFYAERNSPNGLWTAWYAIEMSAACPDKPPRFDEARTLVERDLQRLAPLAPPKGDGTLKRVFVSNAHEDSWFNAASLSANIAAFEDLHFHGAIEPETAGKIYWVMVEDVLPLTRSRGMIAEAVVSALSARAAMVDPEQFLWLSSPRQKDNPLHNPPGLVYNHDVNQFITSTGSTRLLPIEIKLQRDTMSKMHYDPSVIRVNVYDTLAPHILGYVVNTNRPVRRGEHIKELFRATKAMMLKELTTGDEVSALSRATESLFERIRLQREAKLGKGKAQ